MSRSRSILCSLAELRASTQGAALLALLTPLAFGSCVADSVSLRITCNVVPEADCTFQTSGLCAPSGALNLAVWRSYRATLRVSNGLKPRNSDVPPQSEPNGIQISELEVELSNSAGKKISFGSSAPNPYTVPASGFIDPGEEGLVGADLIPAAYVKRIIDMQGQSTAPNQIRLSVIVRGSTAGAVDVDSGAWNWAIDVGRASVDAAAGACTPSKDDVCRLGQDGDAYACDPATVME